MAPVKVFRVPQESFGELDAETTATLIATAVDVAFVVDGSGVIQDIAFSQVSLASELADHGDFLGRQWIDTVIPESRPKVETLLRDAETRSPTGWRQINQQPAHGADVPILYAALRIGGGRVVALGRDLRAVAKLQRQLVEAQLAMERDYLRLRNMETRYRLLFQVSSEAALIVDASNHKILEANPAAVALLGIDGKEMVGRTVMSELEPEGAETLRTLFTSVHAAGRVDDRATRLAHDGKELSVSASLFRQGSASLFLVRFLPRTSEGAADHTQSTNASLLQFIEHAPDGVVVTDREGRILSSNAAFSDIAQLTSEQQARGQLLERWLGRSSVDFSVLMANLRQHGSVRLFATTLRGEYGAAAEIEVSAVPLVGRDTQSFGFLIRHVGLRLSARPPTDRALPRSVEQLTELIGRVPLREIVRETTDVIERLYIEAALELTRDNRASAAEMLGLSRQSLYVKLRRHGLAEAAVDDEGEDQQDA